MHKPIGIMIKKICNDKNVKNNEQMKNIVRVVVTYQFFLISFFSGNRSHEHIDGIHNTVCSVYEEFYFISFV